MGAGGWVSGGIRRAVSGVRSAMPGPGEPEAAAAEQVAVEPSPREPATRKPAATKSATRKPAARKPAPTEPAAAEPAAAEATAEEAPTWTAEELAGFRAALEIDINRLREELHMGEVDMADLLADSGDGGGDDQADAGSKTLEREQEMSVNANARDLLDQSTHALRRLEAGTYGICESCGRVIPAARLRAFPRATLCIACKQAEERR